MASKLADPDVSMARLGGFLVRPPRFFVSGVLEIDAPSVVVGVVLLAPTTVADPGALGVFVVDVVVEAFMASCLVKGVEVTDELGFTDTDGPTAAAADAAANAADRAMDLFPRFVR